jgi:hypothetical protein
MVSGVTNFFLEYIGVSVIPGGWIWLILVNMMLAMVGRVFFNDKNKIKNNAYWWMVSISSILSALKILG